MNFIAFDLETTGIKAETGRIVEIGAVRFMNGEPDAEFSTLINPGMPIPWQASQVNGISDEMVADAPPVEEKLPEFAEFCADFPLVAHNAAFDYRFMLAAVELHQAPAPKGVVLDSCALARKVLPGLVTYKLEALADYFRFPPAQFHRATDDSRICGMLFHELVRIVHERGDPVSAQDLAACSGKALLKFPQFGPKVDQLSLF